MFNKDVLGIGKEKWQNRVDIFINEAGIEVVSSGLNSLFSDMLNLNSSYPKHFYTIYLHHN